MEKLVLIDGNSLVNRAYFAVPALNDKEGRNVNGVYGFLNILLKVLSDYKPTRLVVAFDKRGENFRKKIYSDYKANRHGMPDDLAAQMPVLHDLLAALEVKVVEMAGVEADDLIGTLTTRFSPTTECFIVTGDRDLLQLVNFNTTVLLTKKGISYVEKVTADNIVELYGLKASQIVEFKALRGDTSDNIPGVRGIGDKTATSLLEQYGTVEEVYAHLDEQKGTLKDKLAEGREMAEISKILATIRTDVDVDCSIDECRLPHFTDQSRVLMQDLQFRSILSRVEFDSATEESFKQAFFAETEQISALARFKDALADLPEDLPVAFCFEEGNVSFAVSKDKQYEVSITGSFLDELTEETVFDALKDILESPRPKILFDGKATRHKLAEFDVALGGVKYDVSLMQYLTEYRSYKSFDEMLAANGMEQKAAALVALCDEQLLKLKQTGMEKLYTEVELPLSEMLFEMESEGVAVDVELLDKMSRDYKAQIDEVTAEIYRLAGEAFNVSSPKQLGEVLFDKLGLPHGKKGAHGYSTANDVLEKLKGMHPIVEEIGRYRLLTKLHSTYVEGLRPFVKRGLVHTCYNQYLTTTGRLSSSDPNLQNIPVRDELGKEIRKLFVSKHGVFVGADYSQIELRLVAAFSGDENLLQAFAEGKDVHRKVAAELLGIPEEMVNPTMRRMAKAVNFGIIYGISSFGLAENVGTSTKHAQEYIDAYFARFPKVKQYMDGNVEAARAKGYVTTLTGRRRYIPEINSRNYNLRSFGERAAMNMPLQGSAADIMKIAMLKVDAAIKQAGLKSKVVLQVHDELIVDCYPDEVEQIKKLLVDNMENAVQIGCKLTVEPEEGANLYEV